MTQNRIRELRKEYKMTQIRLSIELEVSQETISAYERNMQKPSLTPLLKMREIFHASCDYILGLSDIRNPIEPKSFSKDEILLIENYRDLSDLNQKMLTTYIMGIQGKMFNE